MTRLNTLFAALAAFSISQSSATIRTHHRGSALPERPNITPAPYGTGQESPYSPPRDEGRYCYVQPGSANGTTRDDAPGIFKAFEDCNDGGTVVLDQSYLISSPLDLTFLQHVDIVITGEVAFDDSDVYYWARNSFKYDFQNMSSFWKIGGEDINIYGDLSNNRSVIDGRGQTYWEELSRNSTVRLRTARQRTDLSDLLTQWEPATPANASCPGRSQGRDHVQPAHAQSTECKLSDKAPASFPFAPTHSY